MRGESMECFRPGCSDSPSSEVMLEVQGLSQPGMVENITFTLHKGEVLGLFGLMGSGRTELARMLFGLDPFERGTIRVNNAPLSHHSPHERIQQKMAFVTE